ncbi:MAG: hypothetical protein IPG64_07445 [Haliea sp.]|nr:hypothetical protein [Haliea sp.]
MVGRFIGAAVIRRLNPGSVLAFNAFAACALLATAMVTHGHLATWAVLAVGLCNSIMFPTIFSLGVIHLGSHTSRGAGLLCVAIVGGAIVPVM